MTTIPAARLTARLRQPRSRKSELAALGRRFRAEERAGRPGEAERELAGRLRRLRARLAGEFGAVTSCGGCAGGKSWPAGAFSGGHCCSGDTGDVFTDREVAALVYGGTRPRHLRAPRTEHAGCAFRGPRGCTLAAADRPNLCARYVCTELRRELHARGRLAAVETLIDEMADAFARLSSLRDARLERAWLADIHPLLPDAG